ncbi:hypothetical protein [Streptomyces sp. NRRL S-813]|uniref:hypothetical protein n=1 Tax=Streptomyces sp. NRRL S-813 TaxID=1463919 RepID=UPI0004C2561C|nr:hypothetical protein [Streptomyces sp. NRRL S-813]
MHSNEKPSRFGRGLSTEDLAQETSSSTGTPVYPGESTGEATTRRPSVERPEGAERPERAERPSVERPERAERPEGAERAERPAATPDTGRDTGTPTGTTTGTAPDRPEPPAPDEATPRLLTPDEEQAFRERWRAVQSRFVDDPREAVHTADTLVADVMQTLAATFARHKQDLEGQWSQGEKVDTEDLRRALQRYRAFFNRLLST